MRRKTNYTKNGTFLIIPYFVILTICFFSPLLFSFSVRGLVLSEMLYIIISEYLSFIFYRKSLGFKEELNKLTFFLFSVLNISLIFITSFIFLNSAINFISLFIGIPAFVVVASLYSHNFISNLEKVSKEALDYMSKVVVIISILFLVLSGHISFSSQVIEQLAVCMCFILISGIAGVIYFYEKSDSENKISPLRKALLFSYSFFLLLLVFVVISSLLVISLPVSLA
jgi:hypothetical protein